MPAASRRITNNGPTNYLEFYEYGRDIGRLLGVSLSLADWRNQNYVFYSGKMLSKMDPATKFTLAALEAIAECRY